MPDLFQIPVDFSIHIAHVTRPCQPHQHDYLELAYIRRGWTKHTLNGISQTLRAGDFALIDYGEVHSYDIVGQHLEAINCMFLPSAIDCTLKNCHSFQKLLESWLLGMGYVAEVPGKEKIFHDENQKIKQLLDRLLEESFSQNMGYHPMVRALLVEIIIQIARLVKEKQPVTSQLSIQWILEEFHRNPGADHRLTEYAKRFLMRPEMLSRLFKKEVGMGFQSYLRRTRIQMACSLLSTTKHSIPQISQLCGYEDVKSFRRSFCRETGQAPLKWKKEASGRLLQSSCTE